VSQLLADLPASQSKLMTLFGCYNMVPLLLAAAAQAEQLRKGGAAVLQTHVHSLLRTQALYTHLTQHTEQQEARGLHNMQQHE
jgi:hypothetical protein